jgi:hypothetical protein
MTLTPTRITYMSKIILALSLALAIAPSALPAQAVVGHTPENSPYRDVKASQRITVFGGYFQAQGSENSATPQSGPAFGLRYDLPVAGPADFFARVERVQSHRQAFDPTLPAVTRSLGSQNVGLYVADLGFSLNLTGRRTWHGIIPAIGFGLGVVSAPDVPVTKDPYDFGTQFAFSADLGLRFNPSNSYEFRLSAGPTFYQNHYPAAYYVTPTGSTPILPADVAKSGFTRSMSYTAGLSIPIFR